MGCCIIQSKKTSAPPFLCNLRPPPTVAFSGTVGGAGGSLRAGCKVLILKNSVAATMRRVAKSAGLNEDPVVLGGPQPRPGGSEDPRDRA